MGTGPFALSAVKALFHSLDPSDSLTVYTKEPKKSGRGMKEQEGCVAQFAKENNLPLMQPHSLKEDSAKEEFLALGCDLVVVASYGLLLPPYVIHAPKFGCVNIHASLLPEYRGAAPINRVIMDGKRITGVTIMQMDEGLDTGDMLMKRETPIGETECAGDLFDRLALMGSEMLLEILPKLFDGCVSPIPQDHSQSTYAAKITREDQTLSFEKTSDEILCKIRGLSPIPSALCRTEKDGKLLKILSAEKAEASSFGKAGEIIAVKPKVLVKTADGAIALNLIQPEGKGKMSASDAVNGRKLSLGDMLL